ncbi:dalmatian [Haematobia irritans]|uniref:dalmatian n=1 Tax=Haematobia irritans TaxID=7368 RepID=UPI003F50425C
MAKVKISSKPKGATAVRKTKNTPTKIAKGKVEKVRTKFEKTNSKREYSDYLSKCYEVQSQTRLCFVNLKRVSIFDGSSLCISDATIKNNTTSQNINIEQAQCIGSDNVTEIKKGGIKTKPNLCTGSNKQDDENKENRSPNSIRKHDNNQQLSSKDALTSFALNESEKDDTVSFKRHCVVRIRRTCIAQSDNEPMDNKHITKRNLPTATRQCSVRLRKLPNTVSKAFPTMAELDGQISIPLSQIENPILNEEKRRAFSKMSLKQYSQDNKRNNSNDNVSRKSNEDLITQNCKKDTLMEEHKADNGNENEAKIVKEINKETKRTGIPKSMDTNDDIKTGSKVQNVPRTRKVLRDRQTASNIEDKEKELQTTENRLQGKKKDTKLANQHKYSVRDRQTATNNERKENELQATEKRVQGKKKDNKLVNQQKTCIVDIATDIPPPSMVQTNEENCSHHIAKSKETFKAREEAISKIKDTVVSQKNKDTVIEKPQARTEVQTSSKDSNDNTNCRPLKDLNGDLEQEAFANTTIELEKIGFVPQRNSTMHFDNFTKPTSRAVRQKNDNNNNEHNKLQEKSSKINDPTKSSENLETHLNIVKPIEAINKTNKFFHRNESERTLQFQSNRRILAYINNKSPISKKHRLLSRRSSQIRREKVYEFLSQSQTSDSEGNSAKNSKIDDPMADVIRKLIAQGKVAVATTRKGKGKPVLKPSKPNRPAKNKVINKKNRIKTTSSKNDKKVDFVKPLPPPPVKANNKSKKTDGNNPEDEEYDHFDNLMVDDEDDDIGNDVDYNFNKPLGPAPLKPPPSHNITDQDGTFSSLAKSVLISQAGRSDAQRLKAQNLLAKVRKLISTPKNNKMPSPQAALNADFSPIAAPISVRPPTRPSPWRVDEDADLPRVFNFSRSSANLPSFSSDFIPPTPRKETPMNRAMQDSSLHAERQVENSSIPSVPSHASTPFDNKRNTSAPSSFSSNDSNAENNPPPYRLGLDKSPDNNANIFDLKQLPNPRRTLTYRSPLKAINILEVVHLPPLKNTGLTNNSKVNSTEIDMFGFEELAANDTFKTPQKTVPKKSRKPSPEKDLFGFEEFLSQTDISSQESQGQNTVQITEEISVHKIHDKLQQLRKLRPDSNDLEDNLHQKTTNQKCPNLFNEPGIVAKPQKTIKEMLCSTMLEKPSTSKKAMEELNLRNLRTANENTADISEIFKDIEPETTFNAEDPHRTYIRPYKRKRRLRENKLIYVLDTDDSGDDDYVSSPEKKSKKRKKKEHDPHKSHETDTSSENPPHKRKRQQKEQPELKSFVEEFQQMCKEVESYELVVEKSA